MPAGYSHSRGIPSLKFGRRKVAALQEQDVAWVPWRVIHVETDGRTWINTEAEALDIDERAKLPSEESDKCVMVRRQSGGIVATIWKHQGLDWERAPRPAGITWGPVAEVVVFDASR
jgi:hypothetical protein